MSNEWVQNLWEQVVLSKLRGDAQCAAYRAICDANEIVAAYKKAFTEPEDKSDE